MKQNILYCSSLFLLFSFASFLYANHNPQAKDREYYAIKVYHFSTKEQENRLDNFLQNAYLPALHRQGTKTVGVFKAIANDTAANKRMYVFFPLKSLNDLEKLSRQLEKDASLATSGKEYLEAAFNNPPYTRMETILLQAFTHMPQMAKPALTGPRRDRVYELRNYESSTENLHRNKVQMFNEGGEVEIFKRLGFNAVFYASVLAGSRMPNLMYMTTFENKASRDEHWKAFSNDPAWKSLSPQPQYKNNVSKNEQIFLYPTDYSDF